jgi:hypothetical protein
MSQFGDSKLSNQFWSKCAVDEATGCWIWNGRRERYGRTGRAGFAHRVAYVALIGDVPAGLELDHLCRNRYCVNPVHLEPVSHYENIMRGDAPAARCARKTHCDRGHEFTADNTYICQRRSGRLYRRCGACRAAGKSRRNKLTLDSARAIRERVKRGEMQSDLAREFGVSGALISLVVSGRSWPEPSANQ